MDATTLDPAMWLRQSLLAVSRSDQLRQVVEHAPVSRSVVARYVPGQANTDAVSATSELLARGRTVTIDYLGEDTTDRAQAEHTRNTYQSLLRELGQEGLTQGGRAEVSLKLSAMGQALGDDGEKVALENARAVCEVADSVGTTVTVDMEGHETIDSTLGIVQELRKDWPWVGAVLQSSLYRTEGDCRDLATEGSRIRLCKGAYSGAPETHYTDKHEVDLSFVRCLKILMQGQGYPMVATHDPRLIEITQVLAARADRDPSSYEMQMLYGIRAQEQQRLAEAGQTFRVYVPYGEEWYGYLVRRMAERPANTLFFLRSLMSQR